MAVINYDSELRRAGEYGVGIGGTAGLLQQRPQRIEHLRVVRLLREQRAIDRFGLCEPTGMVVRQRLLECGSGGHVREDTRSRPRRLEDVEDARTREARGR